MALHVDDYCMPLEADGLAAARALTAEGRRVELRPRSAHAPERLHRRDCERAASVPPGQGEGLELVWAPSICPDCDPDVTMGLDR